MMNEMNRDLMRLYEGVRTEEDRLNRRLAINLILGLEHGFFRGELEGNLSQLVTAIDLLKELESLMSKSIGLSFELEKTFVYLAKKTVQNGVPLASLMLTFKSFNYSEESFKVASRLFISQMEKRKSVNDESSTPTFLNRLMIELIKPMKGSFYDGTVGLGGTLLAANRFAKNYNGELQLYGQEFDEQIYHLLRMKFYVLDLQEAELVEGDVLKHPRFLLNQNQLMKFDYVAMHFPLGLRDEEGNLMANDKYGRLLYGTPSRSGVDYLFIAHVLQSLKENGKGAVLVPNGTLFRHLDTKIRANLVASDMIEAIIALPELVFSRNPVQTNLIIFNKEKVSSRQNKILFINATQLYEGEERRQRKMTDKHLSQILKIFTKYLEVDEMSKIVSLTELKEYNLLPTEYINQRTMFIPDYGLVKFDMNRITEAAKGNTIGGLGEVYRGISITSRNQSTIDGEFRVIQLADVQNGELKIEDLARYNFSSNTRTQQYIVEPGDLLVSCRGAQIKMALVPNHEGQVLLSQNFIGIRLEDKTQVQFLKTYLESPVGQYLLTQCLSGTGVLTLTTRQLMDIPVILPSIEERSKMMEAYEHEKAQLEEKIKKIQFQQKQNQLVLYDRMGLSSLMKF